MNVLVMGGSLFNGRSLVQELVVAGHDVTVSNRGQTKVDLPTGVERIVCDRTDHAVTRAALAGKAWDAVVDMSAYHPEDAQLMLEILEGNVGHYIFVSSTVIYASGPDPIVETSPLARGADQNEYGLHKILAEDLLIDAHGDRGFPVSIAALGMVFGPGNAIPSREQRMFARMRAGRKILVPGDGSTRGIVGYIDDQSRAITAMLGNQATFGRRFNITGDDPHSDMRYVEAFAAVAGTEPTVAHIPAEVMNRLWDGGMAIARDGGPAPTLDFRPTAAATDRARPHAVKFQLANLVQRLQPNLHRWDRDTVTSVDSLKDVTGWEPRFDFEAAVEATYSWWQDAPESEIEHDFGWEDEILALF